MGWHTPFVDDYTVQADEGRLHFRLHSCAIFAHQIAVDSIHDQMLMEEAQQDTEEGTNTEARDGGHYALPAVARRNVYGWLEGDSVMVGRGEMELQQLAHCRT